MRKFTEDEDFYEEEFSELEDEYFYEGEDEYGEGKNAFNNYVNLYIDLDLLFFGNP